MPMYLVQIFLPRFDNAGQPQARTLFQDVERELVERFGGMTAYRRAAEGKWLDGGTVDRDELVICEVMTSELDREWWTSYRGVLEKKFMQKEIVIRSMQIEQI